jgi:hypothetical protein
MTGNEKLDKFIEMAAQAKDLTGRTLGLHMTIAGEDATARDQLATAYATSLRAHGLVDGGTSWINAESFKFVSRAVQAIAGVAEGGVIILQNAEALQQGSFAHQVISAALSAMENRDCTLVLCGTREALERLRQSDPGLERRLHESADAGPALPETCLHKDITLMKPIGAIRRRPPAPS